MGAARLPDDLLADPRVAQVGPLGLALYVGGTAYSVANSTAGFVSTAAVSGILPPSWQTTPSAQTIACDLVDAGLWDPVIGGYSISGFQSLNATSKNSANGSTPHAEFDPTNFVGHYVACCREFGVPAISEQLKSRVGRAARLLREAGHDPEAIRAGLRELARRNDKPGHLEYIVGDVERVRNGTPTGRIIPPPIYAQQNPVDQRAAQLDAEIARRRSSQEVDHARRR